jgi:5-methyltetrahydropteroyltriglutamate--homocysteine methyltransferase
MHEPTAQASDRRKERDMTDLRTIRTDVVGSLLRPAGLIEARKRFDEGALAAAALRAVEDEAVRAAVTLQESVGLDVISDGEMRRLNFQDSFGAAVEGFDASASTLTAYARRVEGGTALRRWEVPLHEKGTAISHRRPVTSRLRLARNVPLEEYKFVAGIANKPAKVSLIGPDRISQRFDHQSSKAVYSDIDAFMADVVTIQRRIIGGAVDAGCRYIHIDAPGYTAYVDEPSLKQMRDRGEDPAENFSRSLKADAAVIAGFPGVTFGIHLCRGNQRSMWHREGAYDAIAERLFNELPHDRFMLEYDTPRAGGFEPLRFVPKDKVVVLGLVSTKTPEMETLDGLQRRIEQATKFIPVEQLAISPQCGFASDVIGNLISHDDQKRKLELVAQTARSVWG